MLDKEKEKVIERIVNKQFEMAGISFTYRELPEDGIIQIEEKKKKRDVYWYQVYQFPNEEMYNTWRAWAQKELAEAGCSELDIDMIDLTYGMIYKYEKQKGQLQLL